MKTKWNPDLYLRFKKERTQPSIDLVKRIDLNNQKNIIDIGCGPGNSTEILKDRWKNADIIGIDSSEQMIEKAQASYPGGNWILSDAYDLDPGEKYDLVFSNAAIQWIAEHERLIPHLISLVKKGGVLAFQVPQNQRSNIHASLYETASEPRFRNYTEQAKNHLNYQTGPYYYDLLSSRVDSLYMWETTYYHVMDSHEEMLDWYRSTGMRPFLEQLPDSLVDEFVDSVRQKCKERYAVQSDGKVIYPFNRLFAVGYIGERNPDSA